MAARQNRRSSTKLERPKTEQIVEPPAATRVQAPITEPDVRPRRSLLAPALIIGAIVAALGGGFLLGGARGQSGDVVAAVPPVEDAGLVLAVTVPDAGTVEAVAVEVPPPPVKTSAGSKPAMLSVESEQPGDVFVDGRKVGPAPQKLRVSPGSHSVQIANASLGRSRVSRVMARAGETASVRETFETGRLNVSVTPWADVFLDGVAIGQTPLAGRAVAAGPHTLKLSSPSGEKSLQVDVPKGQSVTVKETLP
jgi:hypothetical protein